MPFQLKGRPCPRKYVRPHRYETVREYQQIDRFARESVFNSCLIVRAIGVAVNLEFFPVIEPKNTQHQMRGGMIMKIAGKITDGPPADFLPSAFK
jgi:hypothetical protein